MRLMTSPTVSLLPTAEHSSPVCISANRREPCDLSPPPGLTQPAQSAEIALVIGLYSSGETVVRLQMRDSWVNREVVMYVAAYGA